MAPVLGSIAVWQAVQDRSQEDHYGDVALLWVITMALAIVAAAVPFRRPTWTRFMAWVQTYKLEIAAVSVLTIAALIIRAIDLNHYTLLYFGDEGVFGSSALDVIAGRLTNPFSTGWMGHPTMWFFMQAEFMRVFGDDIAGSRLFSALLGTATIPVTYLFVRRHMGIPTALTAAALVTVFHFHIFWSRNALNNISSAFFIILVLWLLDRVIDEWKPVDALLAGLAIGLSQFGYSSNLVLIGIALVYLVYAVVAALPTTREELEEIGFKALSRGVLIGLGALLGFLPLAAYYVKFPETRNARVNQVSIFATGWLDQERELTGHSNADYYLGSAQACNLAPLAYHAERSVPYWTTVRGRTAVLAGHDRFRHFHSLFLETQIYRSRRCLLGGRCRRRPHRGSTPNKPIRDGIESTPDIRRNWIGHTCRIARQEHSPAEGHRDRRGRGRGRRHRLLESESLFRRFESVRSLQ